MRKKPDILSCKRVAQSTLFDIEQVDLRFSNGEQRYYERIRGRRGEAVLVVPMLDDDTVLLIEEYAVGIENYTLGLPKGIIDPKESIIETANRELKEEVGYGANKLHFLKTFSLAPGYFTAKIHVVLAQSLYEECLTGDEPESITVVPWRLSALETLLARDDVTEARSIAALYLAKDYLSKEKKHGSSIPS